MDVEAPSSNLGACRFPPFDVSLPKVGLSVRLGEPLMLRELEPILGEY